MDKRKIFKAIVIFTAIAGIITVIGLGFEILLPIYLSYKLNRGIGNAASIGIIGGADGPTSIFIASQPSPYFLTGIFALLTVVGILTLFIIKRSAE